MYTPLCNYKCECNDRKQKVGDIRTTVLVSGVFSLTAVPTGLMGTRGRMAVAVTEPGAASGGVGVVTRDCWLLSRDWRRAGRLFWEATTPAGG